MSERDAAPGRDETDPAAEARTTAAARADAAGAAAESTQPATETADRGGDDRVESPGPTGPAQTTEAEGDPMREDRTGRSEAGAAAGFAVGTGVGGPPGAIVGAIAGAAIGAATPDQDRAPGESDAPAGEPASEGTGPLDPIMRSTMSH